MRPRAVVPKEVRFGARNQDLRIFVNGVDVTPWVSDDPSYQIAGHEGINSLTFSLVNAHHNFEITTDDIERARRAWSGQSTATVTFEDTRYFVRGQAGEYDDSAKVSILNFKVESNSRAFQQSTSFGAGTFEAATTPDGQLLGANLGYDDWLYPMTVGSTIFHRFDTVRCYRRWPYTKSVYWYPVFTGVLVSARLSEDKITGQSTVSVQCSDIREVMRKLRVQTNNIPQVSLIIPDVLIRDPNGHALFEDLILSANASHTLAPLAFPQIVALLTFGEVLSVSGAAPQVKTAAQVRQEAGRAGVDYQTRLVGVLADPRSFESPEAKERTIMALYIDAGSVFYGTQLTADQLVDQAFIGETSSQLEGGDPKDERFVDGLVEQIVNSLGASTLMYNNAKAVTPLVTYTNKSAKFGNFQRGRFQSGAGYPDEVTLEEWHSIAALGYDPITGKAKGLLTEAEMVQAGRNSIPDGPTSPWSMFVHMIVPSTAKSIAYDLIEYSLTQYNSGDKGYFKREWSTRLDVLNELCSLVDYQFWVSPDGDLLFEFPCLDFMPCDLGPQFAEAYVMQDDVMSINIEDDAGDVPSIVGVQGGITWQELAQNFTAPLQFKAYAWSPQLIHRYGANEKTVSKPFISDPKLLEKHARLELQKALAAANRIDVTVADRPFVLPNRPVMIVEKLRVGVTGSVSTVVPLGGEAPSLSFDLTFVKRAQIGGQKGEVDGSGIQFRLITGGLSSPVPYNQLYLQDTVKNDTASPTRQGSFTGQRDNTLRENQKRYLELDDQIAAAADFRTQQRLIQERDALAEAIRSDYDFLGRSNIDALTANACSPTQPVVSGPPAKRTSAVKSSDVLDVPTDEVADEKSPYNPSANGIAAVPETGVGPMESRDKFMRLLSQAVTFVNEKEQDDAAKIQLGEVWSQIRASSNFAGLGSNAFISGTETWAIEVQRTGKAPRPGPLGIGGITPAMMADVNRERAKYGLAPQQHPNEVLSNLDKPKVTQADLNAATNLPFWALDEQLVNTALLVKVSKKTVLNIAKKYGEDRKEIVSALAASSLGPSGTLAPEWYLSGACDPACDAECRKSWYEKYKDDPAVRKYVKEAKRKVGLQDTEEVSYITKQVYDCGTGSKVVPCYEGSTKLIRGATNAKLIRVKDEKGTFRFVRSNRWARDYTVVWMRAGIMAAKSANENAIRQGVMVQSYKTTTLLLGDACAKGAEIIFNGEKPGHQSHLRGVDYDTGFFLTSNTTSAPLGRPGDSFDSLMNLMLVVGWIANSATAIFLDNELIDRLANLYNTNPSQVQLLFSTFDPARIFGAKNVVGGKLVRAGKNWDGGILTHVDGHADHFHVRFTERPVTDQIGPDDQTAAEEMLDKACKDLRNRAKYKATMDRDVNGIRTSSLTGVRSTVIAADNPLQAKQIIGVS